MLYFQHKFFANWQPNDTDTEDSEDEYTSSGEEGDSVDEDSELNSGDELDKPNDAPDKATSYEQAKGTAPVKTKDNKQADLWQPSASEHERARSEQQAKLQTANAKLEIEKARKQQIAMLENKVKDIEQDSIMDDISLEV